MNVPRLRMFAGPNGSGKSTIKSVVPAGLLGVYVNPDEIQRDIEDRDFLNVRDYGVETTEEEILPFFKNSSLLQKAELDEEAGCLRFMDGKLRGPIFSTIPAREPNTCGWPKLRMRGSWN